MDEVDGIVASWLRERPDLDVAPLHVLSRISRLAAVLDERRSDAFVGHGLQGHEFDVLSVLRRSGEPFERTAGELAALTYVTSGTMTSRLDRLVARAFVTRHPDPGDGRLVRVRLTMSGRQRVDAAFEQLLDGERALLAALPAKDRELLAAALRDLLVAAEGSTDGDGTTDGSTTDGSTTGGSATRPESSGLFVAFEGGEGSGKTSQVALLAAALRTAGHRVVVTREPGGTPAGTGIRNLLLHDDEPLSPRAEALLFAADRAQHVDTVIGPGLRVGAVVVTDRYVDSSLAYQGAARGLAVDEVRQLSTWASDGLVPHLTVLLDVPAATGLARARAGAGEAVDKLEAESLAFHEAVRDAFLSFAAAEPQRYLVLDAGLPPATVAGLISTAVLLRLGAGR